MSPLLANKYLAREPKAAHSRISALLWRTAFRFSARRRFRDCTVGVFLSDNLMRDIIDAKSAEAFELLHAHSARDLARVHLHTDGVLVFGTVGPLGQWLRTARLIRLSEAFIARPETQPAHIAGTLVHEATHAWLENLGFSYRSDRRQRIEAICYRAEAAFARRIPGGENLATYYKDCAAFVLDQSRDEWSTAAFRAHHVNELRELGAPNWLLRLVSRSTKRAL